MNSANFESSDGYSNSSGGLTAYEVHLSEDNIAYLLELGDGDLNLGIEKSIKILKALYDEISGGKKSP